MRMLLLIFISTCLSTATVHADSFSFSLLKCNGQNGQSLFEGVVQTANSMDSAVFMSEAEIPYIAATRTTPYAVTPRPALERLTGITLPQCRGPYARIFERIEKLGTFHCFSGQLTELDEFGGSDHELFNLFNLESQDAACSITLTGETLDRLPRGNH